jgi:hypothetical protein
LTRIGKLEPEAADAQQFFDQVFKGRITSEDGKVERGRL